MSKKFLIILIIILGFVIGVGYWLTNSNNNYSIITTDQEIALILDEILPTGTTYKLIDNSEVNKYSQAELILTKSAPDNLEDIENNIISNLSADLDISSSQSLLIDPNTTLAAVDSIAQRVRQVNLESVEEVDQNQLELNQKIQTTIQKYSGLKACNLPQINTTFVGLEFLEESEIEVNYLSQLDSSLEPSFDIISQELNNLIQKEQRYLLISDAQPQNNLDSISKEAGIELITIITSPQPNTSIDDLLQNNFNSLSLSLEC